MHQKHAANSPVVISSLYNFTSLLIATTSLSISLGYWAQQVVSSCHLPSSAQALIWGKAEAQLHQDVQEEVTEEAVLSTSPRKSRWPRIHWGSSTATSICSTSSTSSSSRTTSSTAIPPVDAVRVAAPETLLQRAAAHHVIRVLLARRRCRMATTINPYAGNLHLTDCTGITLFNKGARKP